MAINLKNIESRKIITILKKMDSHEMSQLSDFISASFNKLSARDIELFHVLKKAHPFGNINQEKLFGKWLKNIPEPQSEKLNKAFWSLYNIVEKWLVLEELGESKPLYNQLLMQAYNKKSQAAQFNKMAQKSLSLLESEPTRDPDFFLQKFLVNSELFYHPDTTKYNPHVKSLEEMEKYLDDFYTATKLRIFCQQLSRKQFINTEKQGAFQEEVMNYANRQSGHVFFNMYLNLIELFQGKDDKKLRTLIESFQNNRTVFNKREQAIFTHLIINHLIHMVNSGHPDYLPLQFEMYEFASLHGLIIFNKRITFASFINIVLTACAVKKFVFANKFIRTNESYLPEEIRADVVRLSYGNIKFQQGQFAKADELLAASAFKNLEFKLLGKALLLRCYYEIYRKHEKQSTLLFSAANNFVKFLKSNKTIAPTKKLVYKNFIQVIRELARFKNKANSERFRKKQQLLDLLDTREFKVISKSWLIRKINGL